MQNGASVFQNQEKINWLTTAVLVVYPLFVIAAMVYYCYFYGTSWFEWTLAIGAYYVANISVGVGLHRLWSHAAYKTNKFVEFVLMMFSSGTLQGPIIAWASDHALHHTYTDQELDPHSPCKYKSKIKGFFWSHIGWMLFGESSHKHIAKGTLRRLGSNKILKFQLKYYWQLAIFMNVFLPLAVGYFAGGNLQSAIAGYVFIGFGRAVQQQMTFCVNSACHFWGVQPYINNTSKDIFWMFFLLLGENWHNFHHAFARDYRNGWKKTQLDVHKWIIYAMSKVGLARDLVVTPTHRVLAKQEETRLQFESLMREKACLIEAGALNLASIARKHMMLLEAELADNIRAKILYLEKSADKIVVTMKKALHDCALSSHEKILIVAHKKLSKLESIAAGIGIALCGDYA